MEIDATVQKHELSISNQEKNLEKTVGAFRFLFDLPEI